ncbi:hypothetical protein niasHS_013100 [Heterodera schachtii]|uniref:TIMELESS-interacting protein n=1 Tax=Heterodera schachtii TaxID=97005 RepID=A0ABD2IHZ3_HETSC
MVYWQFARGGGERKTRNNLKMELEDFDENDLFIDNFDEEEDERKKTEHEIDGKEEDEMTDEQKRKLLESVFEETEKELKKKAKPRKPRLTLTERELLAEKGIPALKTTFDNYKFPEEMDPYQRLNILLGKMEFWAHNLFPSMTFNDCLKRFEQLGKKRIVKNGIRRLRLGMPLDDENVGKDDEKEEEKKDGDDEQIDEEEGNANNSKERADSPDKNEGEETDDLDAFFERMRKGKGAERSVDDDKKSIHRGKFRTVSRDEIRDLSSVDDAQSDKNDSLSDIEAEQFSKKKRKKIIIDDDEDDGDF